MRNATPPQRLRSLARALGAVVLLTGSGCVAASSSPVELPGPLLEPFPEPFQIIAHRGASAYAPENTLPAFRAARRLGAVEVELDVQLSRDGRVVLFHDSLLAPKTGKPGRVRDYTLDELREVEIGSWFDATHPEVAASFAGTPLDALSDLFDEMGRDFVYHVELKDGEAELPSRVLAVIDRFGLRDRVIVTSFRFEQLERIRALAPELPTCLLIAKSGQREDTLAEWIARADGAGIREVGVAAQEISREQVEDARARGLWIRAWSVKSLEDMEHAIAVGANGMTIDWPEKLIRRLLEHRGSARALGQASGSGAPAAR